MLLAEMTGESAPRTHGSGLSTNGMSGGLVVGSASCGSVLVARMGRDASSIGASVDFSVSFALCRRACALPSHAVLYAPIGSTCAGFVDTLPRRDTAPG